MFNQGLFGHSGAAIGMNFQQQKVASVPSITKPIHAHSWFLIVVADQ